MKATARMDAVKAGEEGIWFPFIGSFHVLIRYLSPRKMREMRDECTTARRTAKGFVDDLDEEMLERKFRDYIIADWRGAKDTDGEDWPCTDESKVAIMDSDTAFAGFVNETTISLDAFIDRIEEESRGNLPSGPSTTPPLTMPSASDAISD